MYRGGAGQVAWVLHRLTGVGVLFFLLIHVLDTFLIVFGPELYNDIIALYRHPVVRVSEVGLAAAVLYHALNGIRITLMDFFPALLDRQRALFYGSMVLFVVIFVPSVYFMLRHVF